MKKNKVAQQLIPELTSNAQTGYMLSPDELGRVTAFFSLLISIDQRNKTKDKQPKTQKEKQRNA